MTLREAALEAYWAWQQRKPDLRDVMEALYRTANDYPSDTPVLNRVPVSYLRCATCGHKLDPWGGCDSCTFDQAASRG